MIRSSSRNGRRPGIAIAMAGLAAVLALSSLSAPNFVCGASPSVWSFFTKPKGEIMSTVQASHAVEHIRSSEFREKVLCSEAPVMVDFYADWCRPCRALAPVLEEVARAAPDARIVKVNVDESPELAARYRIESIPHLLVFQGGRLIGQHAGLASKARLRELLTQGDIR